ncbi:MAG: ribosomal-processing cysteine protease Prp [Candidatus Rifleibacteriota bacterium]
MIVIEFPEPDGNLARLVVKGHSGSAPKGQDIVCAAVSALVQTMAGGIQDSLKADVNGQLENGDASLKIKVDPQHAEALKLVCKVFRFGFQKICESYPEHVKMN